MTAPLASIPGFTLRTMETAAISAAQRAAMHALFDANYRQANHPFLEKSFGVLGCAAFATSDDGTPAGFALGETRIVDLPRLPAQCVGMAGICCVAPDFRRRGLFGALEMGAMLAAGVAPTGRFLGVGRMAHPASMRTMMRQAGAVPRPGVPLTAWQREIGRAVAALYQVSDFDDMTFVCRGSGAPIGYPVIELEVEPGEWEIFAAVDRDRGDSLLGMGWRPDPPAGWDDPD